MRLDPRNVAVLLLASNAGVAGVLSSEPDAKPPDRQLAVDFEAGAITSLEHNQYGQVIDLRRLPKSEIE